MSVDSEHMLDSSASASASLTLAANSSASWTPSPSPATPFRFFNSNESTPRSLSGSSSQSSTPVTPSSAPLRTNLEEALAALTTLTPKQLGVPYSPPGSPPKLALPRSLLGAYTPSPSRMLWPLPPQLSASLNSGIRNCLKGDVKRYEEQPMGKPSVMERIAEKQRENKIEKRLKLEKDGYFHNSQGAIIIPRGKTLQYVIFVNKDKLVMLLGENHHFFLADKQAEIILAGDAEIDVFGFNWCLNDQSGTYNTGNCSATERRAIYAIQIKALTQLGIYPTYKLNRPFDRTVESEEEKERQAKIAEQKQESPSIMEVIISCRKEGTDLRKHF